MAAQSNTDDGSLAGSSPHDAPGAVPGDLAARTAALRERLAAARYAVIVYDGEPNGTAEPRRAESLIALTQQLNATIRCSLAVLRGGGNRSGAESVLTWQTGFPMTVDFSRGFPRYRPDEGAVRLLERRDIDLVLIIGDPRGASTLPIEHVQHIAIGPHASEHAPNAQAAIDTGVAGIHDGGTMYRMDDIPLPLRPSLSGPPQTVDVLSALAARVRARAEAKAGATRP